MQQRPSPWTGVRAAWHLWRLVLAVWLVPALLLLPLRLGWRMAIIGALADLPVDAPRAEAVTLVVQAVRDGFTWQLLLLGAAVVQVWLWTVLWHAAVVQWRVWAWERPVELGPVLGFGLRGVLPYLRLALTGLVVTGAAGVGLWMVLSTAIVPAARAMAETAVTRLVLAGLAATALLVLVSWLATLRAYWLLGLPARRSAVLAYAAGVLGTLRQPLASVGTLLVLAVPAALLQAAPLLAGAAFPALRTGFAVGLVGAATGLGAAFGWVALVAAFAPVIGLPEAAPPRAAAPSPSTPSVSPPPAAA